LQGEFAMSFAKPITYTSNNHYDTQFVIDVRRLRPVFQHLDPVVREQIAKAFRTAYPDLLITAMPNGIINFEKV